MGMDRNCRPAGHRRRRLVSVPAAPVARDLRAMDRRPRDLGRRAVRAGLHSRHHLAHPGVVADDRCGLAVRRLGRCDHRRHGHDRRIGGLSDRPLSRAPRFTHCSNGGGYFPRSTTQWARKVGRSSRCCASALGAAQSSELPIGRHHCLVPGLRLSDLSGDHPGHGALHVYLGALGKAAGNGGVSAGTLKWALFGTGLLATVVLSVS